LSGVYPNHYPTQAGESIFVTVSPSKTPQQIAKDLERRFLPKYIKELQAQKDRIRRQMEYEQNQKNALKRIADHFGIEYEPGRKVLFTHWEEVYSIRNDGEDTVKFDITCSPEKAIQILELLQD
jgi:hypothetical protein